MDILTKLNEGFQLTAEFALELNICTISFLSLNSPFSALVVPSQKVFMLT